MRILVTGSSGFIESGLTLRFLVRGDTVIGLDNHNNYYDPAFKEARFDLLKQFHYQPDTTVPNGIQQFVAWFRDYYKVNS